MKDRKTVSGRFVAALGLAAVLVVLPATVAAADTWTGSRTCSSPATQSRLSSYTTGWAEHYRGAVRGGLWYDAGSTYHYTLWGLGTATYKVVADSIQSTGVACIGS